MNNHFYSSSGKGILFMDFDSWIQPLWSTNNSDVMFYPYNFTTVAILQKNCRKKRVQSLEAPTLNVIKINLHMGGAGILFTIAVYYLCIQRTHIAVDYPDL